MKSDFLSKTIDVIRLLLSKMGKRLGEMNNKTAWPKLQKSTLTTYTHTNFEQIATAIGISGQTSREPAGSVPSRGPVVSAR